jgi:hypothetical protein
VQGPASVAGKSGDFAGQVRRRCGGPKLVVTASLDAEGFASRIEDMMERRGMRSVIDAPRTERDLLRRGKPSYCAQPEQSNSEPFCYHPLLCQNSSR